MTGKSPLFSTPPQKKCIKYLKTMGSRVGRVLRAAFKRSIRIGIAGQTCWIKAEIVGELAIRSYLMGE